MASPGELMLTISQATGVPLPTITDLDRRLTIGGLRTKGGRGRNAAQMTSLDAARLLTAVLASHQSTAALEAVQRYAETRLDKARSTKKAFAQSDIADLARLPARHGFVDALDALIASLTSGALYQLMQAAKGAWNPHIEIFAFTRATRGRIRLSGLPNGLTASVEYIPPRSGRTADRDAGGDLEQSRRITEATILPIAELLREGPAHDRASP